MLEEPAMEPQIDEPQRVVDLPEAGSPADQGLSSLGLLMQLAGTVLAAQVTLGTFILLFDLRGGDRKDTLWLFLILGLCVGRCGGRATVVVRRLPATACGQQEKQNRPQQPRVALMLRSVLGENSSWSVGCPGVAGSLALRL